MSYKTWERRYRNWERQELVKLLKKGPWRADGHVNMSRLASKLALEVGELWEMCRRNGLHPKDYHRFRPSNPDLKANSGDM